MVELNEENEELDPEIEEEIGGMSTTELSLWSIAAALNRIADAAESALGFSDEEDEEEEGGEDAEA